jgi:hypothetical protein
LIITNALVMPSNGRRTIAAFTDFLIIEERETEVIVMVERENNLNGYD